MEIVIASALLGFMCLVYLSKQEVEATAGKEQTLKEKYVEALKEAKDMEMLNIKLLVQSAIDNGNYIVKATGAHLDVNSVKQMLATQFPELEFNVRISKDCCSEVIDNITITISKPLVL